MPLTANAELLVLLVIEEPEAIDKEPSDTVPAYCRSKIEEPFRVTRPPAVPPKAEAEAAAKVPAVTVVPPV